MKINVEEGLDKPFLPDGRHEVEITHVDEGKSEYKGVPFFACRMENEDGFVSQRFYTSAAGMPIIMDLFRAVGLEIKADKKLDTNQLIGKKLSVEVGDYTYNDPENGNERTLKQASHFEAA
ncbi:hypothetical protein J2I47_10165 [Fibrella sp. HMF5335]|uniref:Uncharacterized protein n=1 Tax=Fibrella rubiginis TaxID=2817060 RepID=A0A939K4N5_9BACT|nr:hypothetical protein [Fibrella rubiginis]MBO0936908.1 hypothetical protein [Fibrella rubiginis]